MVVLLVCCCCLFVCWLVLLTRNFFRKRESRRSESNREKKKKILKMRKKKDKRRKWNEDKRKSENFIKCSMNNATHFLFIFMNARAVGFFSYYLLEKKNYKCYSLVYANSYSLEFFLLKKAFFHLMQHFHLNATTSTATFRRHPILKAEWWTIQFGL